MMMIKLQVHPNNKMMIKVFQLYLHCNNTYPAPSDASMILNYFYLNITFPEAVVKREKSCPL